MKKKLLLILSTFIILSGSHLFAGPFGLSMGMTFEEVNEACGWALPKRIADDDRYYITPLKKHSMFDQYIAWIDDEEGLYYIRAISHPIYTSKFGEELQNCFYDFNMRLEKIYGKSEIFDSMVTEDLYYKNDDKWLEALEKGYRKLEATWKATSTKETFKDDIIQIYLWTDGKYLDNKSYLYLDYKFLNDIAVEYKEDEFL